MSSKSKFQLCQRPMKLFIVAAVLAAWRPLSTTGGWLIAGLCVYPTQAMRASGRTDRPATDRVIPWLLEGDPAIRWQTMRDLVGAAERAVERERATVARAGWGARLLARQDPGGTWAGGRSPQAGLYSPKWTSTTYTMLLLRDLGLPANNRQAHQAC